MQWQKEYLYYFYNAQYSSILRFRYYGCFKKARAAYPRGLIFYMLYYVALLLLAIKAVITIQDYQLNSLLYLRGGFLFSLFGQLLLWISLAIQIFDLSTINHSFYLF